MQKRSIDGFEVQWLVKATSEGRFRVFLTTCAPAQDAPIEWEVPGGRLFQFELEAQRHGHYVALGLQGIRSDGEPIFTVV